MAVHFGFSIWDWIGWGSTKSSEDAPKPEILPETLEGKFEYYLLSICALCSDGEEALRSESQEHIQACTQAIASDLESFAFPLSEGDCTRLETHLNLFDSITDKTSDLTGEKRVLLKCLFREACADSIKEKWVPKAVGEFYGTLLFLNREGRILNTQIWANRFLQGASYLGKLRSKDFSAVSYPEEFVELAKKAFENHYNEALKERIESTKQLLEWDPELFWARVETLQAKAKGDPSFLTAAEIQLLEDSPNAASKKISYQMHNAILECKTQLLEASLSSTHTQQQLEPQQIGDFSSEQPFAKIFADLEALEDKYLFAKKDVSEGSSTF